MSHRWIRREVFTLIGEKEKKTRWTLMFYDQHPMKFTSSCQVIVSGDVGKIDTLQGDKFYEQVSRHGIHLWNEIGVKKVRASISAGHAKLMAKAIESYADVKLIGPDHDIDGVELIEIEIVPL